MKYILYTTSRSSWIKKQADIFATEISKTKGRGEVTIDVVYKDIKKIVVTTDANGVTRPSWDWFDATFPQKDYVGVIFHFTPALRKKWKISLDLNGSQNNENTTYPAFWVCCNTHVTAKGYDNLSEFLRLLFHEHAHFDENLDDKVGNILTHNSVHYTDYTLKKIHLYHYLVDYRGQTFKDKVNTLVNKVIKHVKKYI